MGPPLFFDKCLVIFWHDLWRVGHETTAKERTLSTVFCVIPKRAQINRSAEVKNFSTKRLVLAVKISHSVVNHPKQMDSKFVDNCRMCNQHGIKHSYKPIWDH